MRWLYVFRPGAVSALSLFVSFEPLGADSLQSACFFSGLPVGAENDSLLVAVIFGIEGALFVGTTISTAACVGLECAPFPSSGTAGSGSVGKRWPVARRDRNTRLLDKPILLHMIRHGQTPPNAAGLITGKQDVGLTAEGRKQATLLGQRLARHYDIAVCSVLRRTKITLELALKASGVCVDRIFTDARLNERSLGEFELQPVRPIPQYGCGDLTYAPEGGESYLEITARLYEFLSDLIDISAAETATHVLLSTHVGPMRIIAGILAEERNPVKVLNQNFSNTEIVKIEWRKLRKPEFI